jgi:hypothetical protein
MYAKYKRLIYAESLKPLKSNIFSFSLKIEITPLQNEENLSSIKYKTSKFIYYMHSPFLLTQKKE